MNTSRTNAAEYAILDDINNYIQTLGSMCALAHVLEEHYGAVSRIAPAMRPGPGRKTQESDPVTPDMVSQGRGIDIIIEVKRSLPSSEGGRAAVMDQITKYCGDLAGWKRAPDSHDVMLMTHISKSTMWADFLDEELKNKGPSLGSKVSVIEYVRDSERETYFIVKKVWGETSNPRLNKHLRNGIVVKGEHLIKKLSDVQFCDSKPNVAYTMSILWDQILPALIARGMDPSGKKGAAVDRAVDLAEVMAKAREATSPFRYPPRQAWVEEALDALVRLKMAKRISDGRFLIHYKSIRSDLVKFFVRNLAKSRTRKRKKKRSGRRKHA